MLELTRLRSAFATSIVDPTTLAPLNMGGTPVEIRGHRSKVHSLDWSEDGSRLASGSTDHTIRVWDAERLSMATATATTAASSSNTSSRGSSTVLRGHGGAVDQVAWCPGSLVLLASVGADKSLRLWDVRIPADPVAVSTFPGDQINLCWHGHASLLAVAGKDDTLSLVDVRKGVEAPEREMNLGIRCQRKFPGEINEMAWLLPETNGSGGNEPSRLLLTRGSGAIEVINANDAGLETLQILPGHTSNAYCIRMAPDGKHFAVGAADALVGIWEVSTMVCVETINRLDWPVRSLAYSHDGLLLAAASEDPFIDISFHPPTRASELMGGEGGGALVAKLPVAAPINALAWHPHRYALAYAGDHVDSRTGRSTGSIYLHSVQPAPPQP